MAPSKAWGDDPAAGEWITVTRSARSDHIGPTGRYPNARPAAPTPAAPTVGEGGSRRLDKYDMRLAVSGEGAPADGFEEAMARCGYHSPTLALMPCAQQGSGKAAAFCLPVAAGGRGGGGGLGDRDAYDYDRTSRPHALELAPTRELAPKPMSMVLPAVVGFKLSRKLRNRVTATDLVLTVTQMLRKHGVVGKFVECHGGGMGELSLADSRKHVTRIWFNYGFLPS